jgi:hypothetical protein
LQRFLVRCLQLRHYHLTVIQRVVNPGCVRSLFRGNVKRPCLIQYHLKTFVDISLPLDTPL